jgi:DNA repair protein RadA/Sms
MFVCKTCDAQVLKWSGRCPECQAWGTLHQDDEAPVLPNRPKNPAKPLTPIPLSASTATATSRQETHIQEIDRVLGGGLVLGSLVLLSGEPGVGKSTLVAAIATALPGVVLYSSGEESAAQLAGRFTRMGRPAEHIHYLEAGAIESLIATIEGVKPSLAIVDSIQTVSSQELEGVQGSPTLVRYATNLLLTCAKQTNIPILVVGQITKDGQIAGPKTLEHLVDVVLSLEGDPTHAFRILRATKNRFGGTEEVGVFEMSRDGLQPVGNPSERFLAERTATPGSVITTVLEGSRVFLVEVQALVEKSLYATPTRRASGFDVNRLQMLTAILSKRAGLKLGDQDVYVNVIGGMALLEPAADLAVCAAIASAISGKVDREPTVYVGEVGLGGEVRSVPAAERRLLEAARMGIARAVVPKRNKKMMPGITTEAIETVADLL